MSAAGTIAILTDRIVSLLWLLLSVGSHGSGNSLQDPDAMDLLVPLFVGKPQTILLVAVVFIAVDLALRFRWPGLARHPGALRIGAIAWGVYAGWEWLVQLRTPEANIRVDLLLIWPALMILSAWALLRTLRA
ncbi:hypothetical protein H8F24_07610 [Synechococcus sp. CBW1002]|uniref:hypothetical protein n=1 Tax=Synechococcus sp. CBW1002 TaxID=1353134 RepID=UPI0018CDFC5D|nr:hypothetical protein [Synechococcus sp. CBW1002]QPN61126.1 hypothetical protein H8F24_07610 [Synechococcus sp. CBW1002]